MCLRPWNWVSALGVKKTRVMVLPGRTRSLMISSAVWIQCTNMTDRRTDGQTDRQTTAQTALTHTVAGYKLFGLWQRVPESRCRKPENTPREVRSHERLTVGPAAGRQTNIKIKAKSTMLHKRA